MKHGGAQSRAGTTLDAEVKTSASRVRLIPFVFSSTQTYALEFGDFYMRIHSNGALVTTSGVAAWSGATTYVLGDLVTVAGVVYYCILGHINHTPANPTYWYAMPGTTYEIPSPYAVADLPLLKFTESADVITFTHASYPPTELARRSATNWAFSTSVYTPSQSWPTNLSSSLQGGGNTGSTEHRYAVTAVNDLTGEESLPGYGPRTATITAITKGTPAIVTIGVAPSPAFGNQSLVLLTGITGMTQLNNKAFVISYISDTQFALAGVDSTNYSSFTGGTVQDLMTVVQGGIATLDANRFNYVSWNSVAGASSYNVYKQLNGTFGFLGVANGLLFKDVGADGAPIDFSISPPYDPQLFLNAGDYPSAVSYIQQRLTFGGSNNNPTSGWLSQSGKFKNFTKSIPTVDSDAVTFRLVGQQVNPIRHFVELSTPIAFTESGEWSIDGDASGIIRPSAVNARQNTSEGCAQLRPLVVGSSVIYLQALGSIIRDLAFNYLRGKFEGDDQTTFSSHLFEGYTIVDWAYQKTPNSIIWAVRSDGVLLSYTLIKDQQISAWAKHDTDGLVENVCCIPEGGEYATYLVVKRTINGSVKRYVERMTTRFVTQATIVDFVGMDCASTVDGRNTTVDTMTLSGGSTWNETETLTLTASAAHFVASDATYNNQIFLTGADGSVIRFKIMAYSSTTVVTGLADRTVPASLRTTATAVWTKAVYHLSGLDYLEGKSVSVFADGYVVGSPNNAAYTAYTVASGAIVLDKPYGVIHVGLPFISDIETLDIDTPGQESISDKMKLVGEVTLFLQNSQCVWVGGLNPADDPNNSSNDPLLNLFEQKIRQYEGYESPVSLVTGKITQVIAPHWDSNGHVFVRNVDPIPMTLLGIAPNGEFPFQRGA